MVRRSIHLGGCSPRGCRRKCSPNLISDRANSYTAITKKQGDWWIGWVEEVPGVNCQERTQKELLDSLRVTLREALQFNREEAMEAAAPDFTEVELLV